MIINRNVFKVVPEVVPGTSTVIIGRASYEGYHQFKEIFKNNEEDQYVFEGRFDIDEDGNFSMGFMATSKKAQFRWVEER